MEMNVKYGSGHSKKYKRTIVEELCLSCDCDDNVIKRHRDINLILRQKRFESQHAVDALRNYVENLRVHDVVEQTLSDEQLHEIVNFREVNTITDAYEYAQFLKKNQKKLRDAYKLGMNYYQPQPKYD